MDVATQGLASLVVARTFVPRAGWRAWGVVVAAGTIANLDFFSSMFGPDAYLRWHRTYTHSIVVSVIVSSILAAIYLNLDKDYARASWGAAMLRPYKVSGAAFFAAVIFAGLLHLVLDAAQSAGTMVFWPVSQQRVALDWLPRVDPWIIAIVLVALLLPELTRLVSDEIGAKSKGGRGRIGAIIGLVVLALYVGLRADLHSDAIATLQNRSYDSGSPHRIAAYADPSSLFIWHGIVETERALHDPSVNIMASSQFDPDNGVTVFKPETSPILAQAQQSETARKFLAIAQFPKAEIEKTADGYEVEIRDLRYAAIGDTKNEVRARIDLNPNGRILNDELVWARDGATR
jgi:inner membrane protein